MKTSAIAVLGAAVPAVLATGGVDLSVDCPFTISAEGPGAKGPINQIWDGQLNINNGAPVQFTLKNGYLFDTSGRGCIITWPQRQLQCDDGSPGKFDRDRSTNRRL
jgi:hypothetical protein